MDMSLSILQEIAKGREAAVLQFMGSQRARHTWVTEQQQQRKGQKRSLEADTQGFVCTQRNPPYIAAQSPKGWKKQ